MPIKLPLPRSPLLPPKMLLSNDGEHLSLASFFAHVLHKKIQVPKCVKIPPHTGSSSSGRQSGKRKDDFAAYDMRAYKQKFPAALSSQSPSPPSPLDSTVPGPTPALFHPIGFAAEAAATT